MVTHIAAEPDTGIITACDVTSANVPDGAIGVKMLENETPGLEVIPNSPTDPLPPATRSKPPTITPLSNPHPKRYAKHGGPDT